MKALAGSQLTQCKASTRASSNLGRDTPGKALGRINGDPWKGIRRPSEVLGKVSESSYERFQEGVGKAVPSLWGRRGEAWGRAWKSLGKAFGMSGKALDKALEGSWKELPRPFQRLGKGLGKALEGSWKDLGRPWKAFRRPWEGR